MENNMDYKSLINNNDPNVWTAYLIERCLDTDEGVSEDVCDAMHKVAEAMPECPAQGYIQKMLYEANATDGFFYLKEDFDKLFGSEFMQNWSVKVDDQ